MPEVSVDTGQSKTVSHLIPKPSEIRYTTKSSPLGISELW